MATDCQQLPAKHMYSGRDSQCTPSVSVCIAHHPGAAWAGRLPRLRPSLQDVLSYIWRVSDGSLSSGPVAAPTFSGAQRPSSEGSVLMFSFVTRWSSCLLDEWALRHHQVIQAVSLSLSLWSHPWDEWPRSGFAPVEYITDQWQVCQDKKFSNKASQSISNFQFPISISPREYFQKQYTNHSFTTFKSTFQTKQNRQD